MLASLDFHPEGKRDTQGRLHAVSSAPVPAYGSGTYATNHGIYHPTSNTSNTGSRVPQKKKKKRAASSKAGAGSTRPRPANTNKQAWVAEDAAEDNGR